MQLPTFRRAGRLALPLFAVLIAAVSGFAADDRAEKLKALGYVETVVTDSGAEKSGVTLHEPARAETGLNLYCSVRGDEARLVDMQGAVVRRVPIPVGSGQDCLVEPYRPGLFLALNDPKLSLLDWSGKTKWSRDGFHHDFAVTDDGHVLSFSEKDAVLETPEGPLPVRGHAIVVLGSDGSVTREIDLLPLFADRIPAARIASMRGALEKFGRDSQRYVRASDVLHPNSIEWVAAPNAIAEKGHVLVGFRELDLVAVVDLDEPRVVWTWGPGELDRPHHPSFLPNGNVLVFDNGARRGYSRVLEVDPRSGAIVWKYEKRSKPAFYSEARGAAAPLRRSNVLITESDEGRVFEVDRGGRIVWEFWNPDFVRGKRRQIYRMNRLSGDALRGVPAAGQETAKP